MSFAEEYRYEITFAYYCASFLLTIVVSLILTICLWHRDKKDRERKEWRDRNDQRRKELSDQTDQERKELRDRRDQEWKELRDRSDQQRKEWRQLAETIGSKYRKLRSNNIPWKISHLKDTRGSVHIFEDITGTDVLRFMINDPVYKNQSRTKDLDALCNNLDSTYQILNRCRSLILLGEVPENIRVEIGKVVCDLGELVLPFYKGEEGKTILKCLNTFGRADNKYEPEVRTRRGIDERIERDVPYLRSLKCGCLPQSKEGDYVNLSFKLDYPKQNLDAVGFSREDLYALTSMLADLENDAKDIPGFARMLCQRAQDLTLIDKIDTNNGLDSKVLLKVLHEIRVYVHLVLSEGMELNKEQHSNANILMNVHKEAKKADVGKEVQGLCDQLIKDLKILKGNMSGYHKSQEFLSQFREVRASFHKAMVMKDHYQADDPTGTNSASTSNETVV